MTNLGEKEVSVGITIHEGVDRLFSGYPLFVPIIILDRVV